MIVVFPDHTHLHFGRKHFPIIVEMVPDRCIIRSNELNIDLLYENFASLVRPIGA